MKSIIFEKKDHLAYITLNQPKQRNALSLKMMNELQDLIDKIGNDRTIHVIVIKGAGPAFCVGHNINELVGKDYDLNHFRNVF